MTRLNKILTAVLLLFVLDAAVRAGRAPRVDTEGNLQNPSLFDVLFPTVESAWHCCVVKSIQVGTCNTGVVETCNVTLSTAVAMLNTIVLPLGSTTNDVGSGARHVQFSTELTTTTNVKVSHADNSGGAEVTPNSIIATEYYPWTMTTNGVQRGMIDLNGLTTNILPVTAVGSKGYPLSCGLYGGGASGVTTETALVRTSTTVITASRNTSSANTIQQCVEVPDWR